MSARAGLWLLALALALAAACGGQNRPGRERYNEGVALLAKGDHAGAQKAFLAARDQAGVDPELRYRAAFNLGMTLTAEADAAKANEEEDPSKALGLYHQAIAWFGDALRVRKGDAASTSNLAIVTARARALEDQLAKEAGRLEARLDAVIAAQRSVLDSARGAWEAIKRNASGDPLAEQAALTAAADTQRGIGAEAGVVADLAAAEIDGIGAKAEDKRSDEEKVRLVQLQGLDQYLMDARARMAEARGRLQELAAEAGAERSEAALVALKRAREQLLDPLAVLRGIAQDQLELLGETSAVRERREPAAMPAWLDPLALAGRQAPLVDRLYEVEARLRSALDAGSQQPASAQGSASATIPVGPSSAPLPGASPPGASPPPPGPGAAPAAAEDPKAQEREQMLAKLRIAMPFLEEALAAMKVAREELGSKRVAPAEESMRRALVALSKAIELFANLKQTLDLAWREQKRLGMLLSPEAAKALSPEQRAGEMRDGLARNLDRLARLRELLEQEQSKAQTQATEQLAKLEAAAAGGAAAAPGASGAPGAAGPGGAGSAAGADPAKDELEAAKARVEQVKQQFEQAEVLRSAALEALTESQRVFVASGDPTAKLQEADAKIEELRRMFFDLVEHLQELLREQSETRDRTAAAVGSSDLQMETTLPGFFERQSQHRQLDQSLDAALAKQADAAGAAGPQGAEQHKKFAAAGEEVRLAGAEMDRALGVMVDVRDRTGGKSHDLKPATAAQDKAISHLEEALRILQPPQKQQQQQQDQQQDQQQQDQQQQEKQQQQAGGATQSARDQDAQRQRRRDRSGGEPVEKDW